MPPTKRKDGPPDKKARSQDESKNLDEEKVILEKSIEDNKNKIKIVEQSVKTLTLTMATFTAANINPTHVGLTFDAEPAKQYAEQLKKEEDRLQKVKNDTE